jgi:2-methylisocitrate lyase-like PEP mutase family enzyme
MSTDARRLLDRVTSGSALVAPGAANALTARVIEDLAFEAVYVTGAGIANTYLGAPDIGLVTLTEVAAHVQSIRTAVDLPLIVDADTGFGNALGVTRTMRLLESSGASAIQLEDQTFPKRCGHFEGKTVIPVAEMCRKVEAAVQARREGCLVIARTDALATEGFDAALARAARYAECGADLTFVEGPTTAEQLTALPGALPVPQVANLVQGGRTPLLPIAELADFGLVILANIALQGAIHGMRQVLEFVLSHDGITGVEPLIADWAERQRIVDKPRWDALERRFADEAGQ